MAQFLANDQVWRMRMVCQLGDQISVNVFHFFTTNVVGSISDEQLAEAANDLFATKLRACLSAQANYRGLSVQRISNPPPSRPAVNTDDAGVGLVAGDALPSQVCGLLSWQTDAAGPGWRGRNYIPFPSEGSSDADGKPTAAYLTVLDEFAAELLADIQVVDGANSAELEFVLYKRDADLALTFIAGIARPGWATQKRRGFFGQQNKVPF